MFESIARTDGKVFRTVPVLAHPLDGRAQSIVLLTLGWTRSKIHEIAEEFFRGLPPVFHHQHDRAFLFIREGQAGIGQDRFYLVFQLGERIFGRRHRAFLREK